MERVESRSILDRPLMEILTVSWEKAAYVVIFVIAVLTRFWDLGARALSHDESLHALYSYYLYNGTGYAHNPMMHGPFLFHANALIYFLFGDTDYTARIVPAIFGVALVLTPLLFKPWLGRRGALFTSILLLISPAILYHSRYIRDDIYMALWVVLMIAALFHLLRTHRSGWLILGATVLMLAMTTMENAYIFGYIGLAFMVMTVLWERSSNRTHLWLYLGGLVITVALLVALYVLSRPAPDATDGSAAIPKLVTAVLVAITGTVPIGLFSATVIRSREDRKPSVLEALRAVSWPVWVAALVIMFLIYSLLFTTFFTNPAGMISGIFGSISYWLAQQEVKRGDQPWYYYLLTLTMYEFLPFLIGTIGVIYYVIRGVPRESEPEPEVTRPGEAARPVYPTQAPFVSFLIFWTLMTLFMYSWAGERMAWLTVHPALAFIFVSGKFLADLADRVDWRALWERRGWLLALLFPIALFGVYTLLTKRPFQGLSIFKLQETGNWLAALVVTVLLLALVVVLWRRLGSRLAIPTVITTLVLILAAFTIRTAWRFAYITYDYATELMVFAHGTPDVVRTMNEIADISRRTVGDKQIKVAYDSDVSWPLEWYMREYPNRVFYGDSPSREQVDVPIVLAGDQNDDKVRPYLGDRYYRFKRRLVWWPTYDYKDLTFSRIWNILTTPEKRKILWDILYWRKYPRSTDDWYYVHNFYMYVRKDVAQEIWGFGGVPPEALQPTEDPYAKAYVDLKTITSWGQVGTESGQFNRPRGVAIGPDGDVYVVDSDNARVQVFHPDGSFARQWGGHCNLADGTGCQDPDGSGPLALGDGQFQEPWGIAVGSTGLVYVADTWNHRIQEFRSDGTFVRKWGGFGQVATAASGEDLFYGPRDVAVDGTGRVFVTDTGNKRIVVFDGDGSYLAQWGGGGATAGMFEEPVGLGVDGDGNVYVADTWNQRVQVFDAQFNYVREWPVTGWLGQSVLNKPFLDVDKQGRVYVTDPEGFRVIVFDANGKVVATFGRYGYEADAFALPTGIAVDAAGYIFVTDPDGQKVLEFEPLP